MIFHSAKNYEIQNVYWRAEQKYRKCSKMIAIAFLVYDQSAYWSTFISSICWILSGNTDASTWPVVFELSVPFDTKTIFGWYLLLLITTCLDFMYFTCMLLGTTQFMGYCIYIAAICEHFDLITQTIQTNIKLHLHEKNPQKCSEISGIINDQFREAIQIHIMIYE